MPANMPPDQIAIWRKVKDAVVSAALWLLIGWFSAAYYYRPTAVPCSRPVPAAVPVVPAPAPAPAPDPPAPAPPPALPAVAHKGHFTVSLIEPRYPSPASAAVRDQLAGENWMPLDTSYRSYTEGQNQLTALGFVPYFKSADLPIVFLQEDGPTGAPIIGSMKSPASADAVLSWVRGFRGP
jgi:hypothetical protein